MMHSKKLSPAQYDPEKERVLEALGKLPREARILDVGCGMGRFLEPLHSQGFKVLGVEANPAIREILEKKGLPCTSPEAFEKSVERYDAILISHVIQFMGPSELLPWIDRYLDFLKPGGQLVVAAPLMTSYFWDDFFMKKIYTPASLKMIFTPRVLQAETRSKHKMVLKSVWYRRGHLRFHNVAIRYVEAPPWSRVLRWIERFSVLAFWLSRGRIGIKDAWFGVFEKV